MSGGPTQDKGRADAIHITGSAPCEPRPLCAHLWRAAAPPVAVCMSVRSGRSCAGACVCARDWCGTLELLEYLQNPELVARFQRRCGLFLLESARCNGRMTHAPPGTASRSAEPRARLEGKQEEHEDEHHSNFQSDAERRAAIVSVFKNAESPHEMVQMAQELHTHTHAQTGIICVCASEGFVLVLA